ncbi:MAG: hypothetical protein DRI88_02295 [Bacteroidetes bacterium]|nr:MAG: hypothetical protein DRI72_00795 [Bacteroidota bacterium]RLD48773.1 MAG: hypothetical protein DRI88_02295 [Bacteroidota bacterium]RLD88979.1 MAG: hypothetical protein DRJ02_02700 [Bacteroidota bacterium]
MNKTFLKLAKGLTIYALIISLISLAVDLWLPQVHITHVYLFLIAFIYSVHFLLTGKLTRAMEDKPNRFINTYMLLNFGKLFLFIIVIAVYAYTHRDDAVSFAVTFMIYYILFTAYEITVLLKINK